MGFKIVWRDSNLAEDGHYIYKSSAPMDPLNLPAPYDSIGPDVTEYVDGAVTAGNVYYYRVGAHTSSGSVVKVSDEIEVTASESFAGADESFDTAIPEEFGFRYATPPRPVDGLVVSYDSTNQGMVLSASSSFNFFYIVSSFPTLERCTIEAEIYFDTDYAARRHIGLLICDADAHGQYAGGYRIAYLDTGWTVMDIDRNLSGPSVPITFTGDNVSLVVGNTYQFRVTFAEGAYSFFVNGTKILSFDGDRFDTIRPGLHLYAAKIRANYVKMWATALEPTP